jgi:hypothetical protein
VTTSNGIAPNINGGEVGVLPEEKKAFEPASAAPEWVKWLMILMRRLPQNVSSELIGVRGVVAGPTSRHIPAAMALAGVRASSYEPPTRAESGMRVATVLSKVFRDARISQVGTRLGFDGTQFDTVKPLPPFQILDEEMEFERGARSVPKATLDLIQGLKLHEAPEWTYQRMCLRPVVVITQRPSILISDFSDLTSVPEWWNVPQSIALVEPESGVEWWYRRPIVVISPASASEMPWLARLPVSMLIVVGFSTWMSPVRHLWQNAQQVLMLNQRSGDIADFRAWFDGADFAEVPLPFARNRRTSGLTITAFGEPISSACSRNIEEGDPWEI